jgi:hypothetical protein
VLCTYTCIHFYIYIHFRKHIGFTGNRGRYQIMLYSVLYYIYIHINFVIYMIYHITLHKRLTSRQMPDYVICYITLYLYTYTFCYMLYIMLYHTTGLSRGKYVILPATFEPCEFLGKYEFSLLCVCMHACMHVYSMYTRALVYYVFSMSTSMYSSMVFVRV